MLTLAIPVLACAIENPDTDRAELDDGHSTIARMAAKLSQKIRTMGETSGESCPDCLAIKGNHGPEIIEINCHKKTTAPSCKCANGLLGRICTIAIKEPSGNIVQKEECICAKDHSCKIKCGGQTKSHECANPNSVCIACCHEYHNSSKALFRCVDKRDVDNEDKKQKPVK